MAKDRPGECHSYTRLDLLCVMEECLFNLITFSCAGRQSRAFQVPAECIEYLIADNPIVYQIQILVQSLLRYHIFFRPVGTPIYWHSAKTPLQQTNLAKVESFFQIS